MTNTLVYDRPAAADLDRMAELGSAAFCIPFGDLREKLEQKLGLGNLRIMRHGGGGTAVLDMIPMGQFFGGRSVRMVGIAGVSSAPERRGRGAGVRLMREMLAELHAAGVPLSGLYPATQPIYRRAGYEWAGSRFEIAAEAAKLDAFKTDVDVRPVREE